MKSKHLTFLVASLVCFLAKGVDEDGDFLHTFGSEGTQPGDFIRPKGIATDRHGHVYVIDAEFNNFQILDEMGRALLFVGSFGPDPGQFILPTGITVDEHDRIYVTEHGLDGGRLQIFQYLPEASAVVEREVSTAQGR